MSLLVSCSQTGQPASQVQQTQATSGGTVAHDEGTPLPSAQRPTLEIYADGMVPELIRTQAQTQLTIYAHQDHTDVRAPSLGIDTRLTNDESIDIMMPVGTHNVFAVVDGKEFKATIIVQ